MEKLAKSIRKFAMLAALILLLSACSSGAEDPRAAQPPRVDPVFPPDPPPSVSIYAATGLDHPNVRKNQYLAEYFQTVDGFMVYTGAEAASHVGIDVSAHQLEIDWEQVADSGVGFAIIRAGYRGYETGNLNLDARFYANMEGALAAGLQVGIYFFSQATDTAEAEEEAAQVLEWIAPYEVTYPVIFDWEPVAGQPAARTNGVNNETVTECAKAFCKVIKNAGYIPMVYFNKDQGYAVMDLSKLSGYDFWLAEYTEIPEFRYHFEMWQYSCTGTVPGIKTPVDLNLCLVDYPATDEEKT